MARRCGARVELGDVAADERARSAARPPRREPAPRALFARMLEGREPLATRAWAGATERTDHGPVHRSEPAPPRLDVEHRPIGKTHEPARPSHRRSPVDEMRDAREPVLAARRDDG